MTTQACPTHGLPVAIVDSDDGSICPPTRDTPPFVTIDSDDGDTCYYTCPHCGKRSHSEFDKWCAVITDDINVPNMICPKCGKASYHPDDIPKGFTTNLKE